MLKIGKTSNSTKSNMPSDQQQYFEVITISLTNLPGLPCPSCVLIVSFLSVEFAGQSPLLSPGSFKSADFDDVG